MTVGASRRTHVLATSNRVLAMWKAFMACWPQVNKKTCVAGVWKLPAFVAAV